MGAVTEDRTRLRTSAALALPALLFGFLVAAQWQTQTERSQLAVRYNAPLSAAAESLQDEQTALRRQLTALRAELDRLQKSSSTQSDAARDLQAQVDALRTLAGLTPVTGEGVAVVLDDAKATSASKDADKSACHATDLTDIINTAWRGGAQAVSVSGERIVSTTSVYCVGATIIVNGTLMSAPFQIHAVGRQDQLLAAFADPEQLKDIKQRRDMHGLGFRVSRAASLTVPEYRGALNVRFGEVR